MACSNANRQTFVLQSLSINPDVIADQMITRMWQGAHALPISHNNENKMQVLRRSPVALQLFFKCQHTEGIIYYFTLLC
jgi:hypothetical protein